MSVLAAGYAGDAAMYDDEAGRVVPAACDAVLFDDFSFPSAFYFPIVLGVSIGVSSRPGLPIDEARSTAL